MTLLPCFNEVGDMATSLSRLSPAREAIAFNSTSCTFIIRSISAAEYC